MSITEGRYIITNFTQRKVAFLADSRDVTQIVCREERGVDETWFVHALRSGHHVIANVKDNRRATAGPRAASGEIIEGRNYNKQWLIREIDYSGQYTIATPDTGRVWGLGDNEKDTPITLFDQSSDPRTWWTFRRVGSEVVPSATPPNAEVTAARRLAEQETVRRKEAEAELARQAVELKVVKRELEEARTQAEWEASDNAVEVVVAGQELEQAKAEATRTLMELQAARREAASARTPNEEVIASRRLVEQEAVRRKEAEAELARQASTLMAVKGELEETRKQAKREIAKREETEAEVARQAAALMAAKGELEDTRKLVEQEMAKRKSTEAETAKKAIEVVEAKREVAQAKVEVAGILAELQAVRQAAAAAQAAVSEAKAERDVVEYEAMLKLQEARGEAAATKAAAAEAAAKREEVEFEASRKAEEVEQAKGEAAQIEEEAQRTRAFIKSFIMPQLETGRYTITNIGSKNAATLSQVNTESYITGGFRQDGDSEKWGIVLLSNDKYTIKSLATGLYANYEPNPRKGEFIFGSSRAQQWKIKSMWSPGHYVIFPAYAHCYWSLPDSEEGTPASHK